MNQRERDELRAKHRVGQNEADDQCQSCFSADGYPCDVIKVLDALESRNGLVNPARMDTCTHYGIDSGGTDYYGTSNPSQESDWNYPFCPKCGEKLEEND